MSDRPIIMLEAQMTKYFKDPDIIKALSAEEFYITQQSGTESPGSGKLLNNKEPGIYVDIVSRRATFCFLRQI